MKYIITESQYNFLFEQSYLGMPTQAEKVGAKQVANSKLDTDDVVDVASGALDTIPGLGNLASLGVDVTHAASYMYRFVNSSSVEEKIEYGIMAFITLITSFLPVGGNVANLAAKEGIKPFVRRTPEEILFLLKKAGVYNKTIFPFQKNKWTFNIGLFLYKITRGKIDDALSYISKTLYKMSNLSKGTPLVNPINDFREMADDIQKNKEVYSKIVQYV